MVAPALAQVERNQTLRPLTYAVTKSVGYRRLHMVVAIAAAGVAVSFATSVWATKMIVRQDAAKEAAKA